MEQELPKNFICENCGKKVLVLGFVGTKNRNHCPFCLWSKHVDKNISGDRKETCRGLMEPIALTFKKEGFDKFGRQKQGEIMLVHKCMKCGDVSINRIAGDDDNEKVMKIYDDSKNIIFQTLKLLQEKNISALTAKDLPEIKRQLFGTK